jgi:TolB-like protein/tetratricopeptide (TPR) repeat protein
LDNPEHCYSVVELLDRVWPNAIVTQNSVYQAVTSLRKALATGDDQSVTVQLVRRRGYRLLVTPPGAPSAPDDRSIARPVGEVSLQADDAEALDIATSRVRKHQRVWLALSLVLAAVTMWWRLGLDPLRPFGLVANKHPPTIAAGVSGTSTKPTLIVLPFEMPKDPSAETPDGAGLAQRLVNRLAAAPEFGLVAYASLPGSNSAGRLAEKLGVNHRYTYALEGKVVIQFGRSVIALTLTDLDQNKAIWSQRFDTGKSSAEPLEDELTNAVAIALFPGRPSVAKSSQPTHIPKYTAYRRYLSGLSALNSASIDSWKASVTAFIQALQADPEFSAPLAPLASAESKLYDQTADGQWLVLSERHAEQAIQRAPDKPEGYAIRGYLRQWYHFNWAGAKADFDTALSLGDKSAEVYGGYAGLLASEGRIAEAIEFQLKAIATDPLNVPLWNDLGLYYLAADKTSQARDALRRANEMLPDGSYTMDYLVEYDVVKGELDNVVNDAKKIEFEALRLKNLVLAYDAVGNPVDAERCLNRLIQKFPNDDAYQVAQIYAWRNDHDAAYQWLDHAIAVKDPGLGYLKYDPMMAKIRSDERYRGILKRIGLNF